MLKFNNNKNNKILYQIQKLQKMPKKLINNNKIILFLIVSNKSKLNKKMMLFKRISKIYKIRIY